jgi:hypothetical protein
LNPSSILQISVLIHLCEAFLGIPASLDLFRHLFWAKPQPSAASPAVIGGVGVQLRDSKTYFTVRAKTSNKGWHAQWFYCKNHVSSLPPHSRQAPIPIAEWRLMPSELESAEVAAQMAGIAMFAKRGLTVLHVVADWLRHRVQPLKLNSHPVWEYSGPSDPTREDPSDFSEKEVTNMMKLVFASLEGFPGSCQAVSFSLEHPRLEVSLVVFFLAMSFLF